MRVLRIKVECNRCKKTVDKLDARELSTSLTRTPRYECFSCFRNSHAPLNSSSEEENKQQLYCGRCHYKFSSRRFACPYCGEADKLMKSNVSIHDIL